MYWSSCMNVNATSPSHATAATRAHTSMPDWPARRTTPTTAATTALIGDGEHEDHERRWVLHRDRVEQGREPLGDREERDEKETRTQHQQRPGEGQRPAPRRRPAVEPLVPALRPRHQGEPDQDRRSDVPVGPDPAGRLRGERGVGEDHAVRRERHHHHQCSRPQVRAREHEQPEAAALAVEAEQEHRGQEVEDEDHDHPDRGDPRDRRPRRVRERQADEHQHRDGGSHQQGGTAPPQCGPPAACLLHAKKSEGWTESACGQSRNCGPTEHKSTPTRPQNGGFRRSGAAGLHDHVGGLDHRDRRFADLETELVAGVPAHQRHDPEVAAGELDLGHHLVALDRDDDAGEPVAGARGARRAGQRREQRGELRRPAARAGCPGARR